MKILLKRAFVLLAVVLVLAACALAAGILWRERLPEVPPSAALLVIENVSVVEAETAIHPFQRMVWSEDADGMVASDPSPEGRKAFMDFYEKGLELTGAAYRAGVPVLAGTDANDTYAFPGSGLHDELEELVKAGLTPSEALVAATMSPARYFGVEGEYGSLAEGKAADLVLLRENPLIDVRNTRSIEAVVLAGRLYRREDLDALLAHVEASVKSLTLDAKLLWAYLWN